MVQQADTSTGLRVNWLQEKEPMEAAVQTRCRPAPTSRNLSASYSVNAQAEHTLVVEELVEEPN